MVRADLERLCLTHDEADLAGLLVFKQLDGAGAPLFPLVPILIESVEFCLPAKANTPKSAPNRAGESNRLHQGSKEASHMSRSASSSSSPVVTATSSSRTIGATWAPVSSSSPAAAAAEAPSSSVASGRSTTGSLSAMEWMIPALLDSIRRGRDG